MEEALSKCRPLFFFPFLLATALSLQRCWEKGASWKRQRINTREEKPWEQQLQEAVMGVPVGGLILASG